MEIRSIGLLSALITFYTAQNMERRASFSRLSGDSSVFSRSVVLPTEIAFFARGYFHPGYARLCAILEVDFWLAEKAGTECSYTGALTYLDDRATSYKISLTSEAERGEFDTHYADHKLYILHALGF